MILIANLLISAAKILHIILMIYTWVILIRAVLSWIQIPSLYQITVIFYYLTEPVLRPLRRFVPPYKLGGIDISPILAILAIIFIDSFLVKSISLYGMQLLRQTSMSF